MRKRLTESLGRLHDRSPFVFGSAVFAIVGLFAAIVAYALLRAGDPGEADFSAILDWLLAGKF